MNRITRGELLAVLLWSAVVMAATAIPYVVAEREAGPDREFGGFIWGVDDGNVYLSWIRQAAEGRVFLRNQYTTRDQSPHFFHVFLLALGRISALTGLAPLTVFMAARYLCGVFCLLAFYALTAALTADRRVRLAALALASVSSGLGWIVVLAGQGGWLLPGLSAFPMDVADGWQAQPEAIIFLSLLLNPLFSFSLGLVALVMLHASRLAGPGGLRAALWAGLLLLVLGNVHGYDIFAIHATLLVWLAGNCLAGRLSVAQAAGRYALLLAVSAASPLWAYWAAHADPAYAAKVETPTLSPRPFDVAVGYGLVLALAVAGAWRAATAGAGELARRRLRALLIAALALGAAGFIAQQAGAPPRLLGMTAFALPLLALAALVIRRDADEGAHRMLLPVVWAACGAAVIYLPVPFQRKMMEGLHLPLCILAGVALAAIIGAAGTRQALGYPVRVALAAALLVATMPSNLLFIGESLRHVRANNRTLLHVLAPPTYLLKGEVEAMRWLAAHAQEDDIVLSSNLTGNYIPAHAPCLVVAGHWAETLHAADYFGLMGRFYEPGATAELRRSIARRTRATFVWWGPQERVLQEAAGGPAYDPGADLPQMAPVFDSGTVTIRRRAGPGEGRVERNGALAGGR